MTIAASNLRARIHRGAAEVGGSCVELECAGQRIVLDLGLPLDASGGDVAALLPPVSGLGSPDPSLLGIVVSHSHPDHHGLLPEIGAHVPVFMGSATHRILSAAAPFTGQAPPPPLASELRAGQHLELGPFRVTPLLTDHSAFESFALLVEAGGRRLLYSGDVRFHGRKPGVARRLLESPPAGIDTLLLEGTTVGRPAPAAGATASEADVEAQCTELFRPTDGMALVHFSPQNIDRLVSIFRAAKRSGRRLVLDLYAAAVVRAAERSTIPQPEWDDVHVYVPLSQRLAIKRRGKTDPRAFDLINSLRAQRIFEPDLRRDRRELVSIFRSSMLADYDRAGCLDGAAAVWSMWDGYRRHDRGARHERELQRRGIPLTTIHASGHAPVADLQRFAAAVGARQVVPIHTDAPHSFPDLFDRVASRGDGAWWNV